MPALAAASGRNFAVVAVAGLLAMGCAGPAKKTGPSPSMAANPELADPVARVRELRVRSAELGLIAKGLPGRTQSENRELFRSAFGSLARTLALLEGPRRTGVFDHQLSVVEDTRAELNSRSNSLSMDPIVDTGLRAVRNALDDAVRTGGFDDAAIADSLDQFGGRVRELDVAKGADHPEVVAFAIQQASDVIGKMTAVLAERVSGADLPPMTMPSTMPAAAGGDMPAGAAPAAVAPAAPAPAAPEMSAQPTAPLSPASPAPDAPQQPAK